MMQVVSRCSKWNMRAGFGVPGQFRDFVTGISSEFLVCLGIHIVEEMNRAVGSHRLLLVVSARNLPQDE